MLSSVWLPIENRARQRVLELGDLRLEEALVAKLLLQLLQTRQLVFQRVLIERARASGTATPVMLTSPTLAAAVFGQTRN